MRIPNRSQPPTVIRCVSGTLLSLVLLATPATVLAHGGHGEDFHGETEASPASDAIQVDAETAEQLGIKVEPVNRQRLAEGIKTTGQIETLPNKQVEVTVPISKATVVELLVAPGAQVKAGQPVAVVAAPDLVELRVESQEKRAEAEANVQQAQADLKLAQQNLERQRQIAAADIEQARTELEVAQEQYDRDLDLVNAGAIPRRQMLESQAHLAEGKAELAKAASRREVLEAEAQLKRAQSAVEVAQSRLRLSDDTYQTRLQQIGTKANAKGLVTVTAPISGRVADREVTLGQSFEDAGGKLMTIVNDSQVFATANIYEKDIDKVKTGQRVSVKVASLTDRTFSGRITVIGSAVEGETRVVPVKAELDNPGGVLKPGMFAELEVLTNRTPTAILVIPSSAVVDTNGKKQVYVQNGNAYQPVEVTLGQTSGDMVEVKSGLFEGDLIVTQRATQLYAQSLRDGSKASVGEHQSGEAKEAPSPASDSANNKEQLPWWLVIPVGGAIAASTFWAGTLWAGRRSKSHLAPTSAGLVYVPESSPNSSPETINSISKPASHLGAASVDESPHYVDNHRVRNQEPGIRSQK
jgi:cobalt-zinc-cadmium efflux system membrane fusion protein